MSMLLVKVSFPFIERIGGEKYQELALGQNGLDIET